MSLFLTLILAAASQAESPACEFEPPPPNRVSIERVHRSLCFAYDYPVFATPMPALEAFLRDDAGRREAEALARLSQSLADLPAEADRSQVPRHSYELGWRLTAETGPLLAMDSGVTAYWGGAHEALSYETLLWDRAADRRIAFGDLFTRPREAYRLLQPGFCRDLLAMQIDRGHTAGDALPCPDLRDQPIALTGASGRIESLTALLAPYVAGSFAEGPYEVELPLTPAVLRLVKRRYRTAFAQPQ